MGTLSVACTMISFKDCILAVSLLSIFFLHTVLLTSGFTIVYARFARALAITSACLNVYVLVNYECCLLHAHVLV